MCDGEVPAEGYALNILYYIVYIALFTEQGLAYHVNVKSERLAQDLA